MNKKVLFSSTLVGLAVSLGLAAPAAAATMEQTQTFSTEFKIECSDTCTHTSSSTSFSSSADQHQFMTTESSDSRDWSVSRRGNNAETDGSARITWSQRGGTCTIRYGESRNRNYPYTTTAACDNGEATIGGLVKGRSYRFQVRKDNEAWSRTITRVAR